MNVPRLRFKEFSGWKINSFIIKGIANIQVGRDLKENSFSEIKTDKYYYPVYSNTVENRGLYGFYDFEEYDGNSLTVVGRGAGLGTAFSRNSGFGAIGRLLVISPKNNEFNVHYFAEYVNFKLRIHNESGGIPQLPGSTFGNYPIVLPTFPEQTKIANFLTVVDEKIAQLTQKGDLLARYKKGVMQQIFSQQLRFKDDDGREFPKWEEKCLGEISSIKRGASPRPIADKKWFSEDSKIGWVRISDVSRSDKFLSCTQQYLSDEGISKSRLVKKGSIIMSICATIGKPIYTNFDVCIHDGFVVFDELKISHEFFYYYLMLIEKNWYQYGQPGSQVNLNSDIVSNEIITIPTPEEQTKIANFLTALDDKITHNQTQLNALKCYKQGLLQQMFV